MKAFILRSCSTPAKATPKGRRGAMRLLTAALLALLVGHGRGSAFADSRKDFALIVNPGNPVTDVSRSMLADLYLKRTTRWDDGELARPIDQRADSEVRRAFSESVLKRSIAAVKRYWQQRIFSGRDLPPPELEGDEAVASYVASHRGAIGYVSGTLNHDKTKRIQLR